MSSSEAFKGSDAEFIQNTAYINKIIYDAYVSQGIKADTSSGTELIQGLEFKTFHAEIYAPDGKKILTQLLYSRLINGYDFSVIINYNNDTDRELMARAFKKSVFKN